jgi:hypothetical protein
MTYRLAWTSLLLVACAKEPTSTPVTTAPAVAPAPAPVIAPRPTPLSNEELVKRFGSGEVTSHLHEQHAIVMSWAGTEPQVTQMSCTDDTALAARVTQLARRAIADGVTCEGTTCMHYADARRVAFVFDGGKLVGVLEDPETADAAGIDDELEALHTQRSVLCPRTEAEEADMVNAAYERMKDNPSL